MSTGMYLWKKSWFSMALVFAAVAQSPAQENATAQKVAQKSTPVNAEGKYSPKPLKPAASNSAAAQDQVVDSLESLMKSIRVEKVSGDRFRIGDVTLDKKQRTVTFPVTVNMNRGVVEYMLVTESGKSHESVFTTKVKPSEIHLACILLGVKPFSAARWPENNTLIPSAQGVTVEVSWPTNGPAKRFPLSDFISVIDPNEAHEGGPSIADGSWFYNGSHFRDGVFTAENEGSIIAVIGDGAALLNGLRTGRENDEAHAANKKILPALGKIVHMTLTLPKLEKLVVDTPSQK